MPRNLDRRVESTFPIQAIKLKNIVIENILKSYLKDNVKARVLNNEGEYQKKKSGKGDEEFCVHEYFMQSVFDI